MGKFENIDRNSYVTFKDHENHFEEDPKVWLINLSKPKLGKISKMK